MLCDDLEGKEARDGGEIYIYIIMTDSRCCTAETNRALSSNFPPIKM